MCCRVFPSLCRVVGLFVLLLGGCAGVDQRRATDLAMSQNLATSPVADFNRDIALRADLRPEKPQDYQIGPQDVLAVTFYNVDESEDGFPGKVQVRVSEEGVITLPLIEAVAVHGQTPTELEQTLRERYKKFMREPEVGVAVMEYHSQGVSVLGAVKNPGVYQIVGPRRLRDLLAMAGGVGEEAGFMIHVSRQEGEEARTYVINLAELSQDQSGEINLYVRQGDVVNIPLAGTFFVDGYVGKPGAYALLRPYTLSQALTVAGGIDGDAKQSDITIFRNEGGSGEVQILKCDLSKIQALQAPDIQISENDVIVVPPSTAKLIVSQILGSIGFGIRSQTFGFGFGRGGGGAGRR